MKLTKYLSHVLTIKDNMVDDGIYTLAHFHKNSATSCRDSRRLWWLKKIVIVEKDGDSWKRWW